MARKKKEEKVVGVETNTPEVIVKETTLEPVVEVVATEADAASPGPVITPTEELQEPKQKKQKEDPNTKRLGILKGLLSEHSVSKQAEPERVKFFLSVIDNGGTVAILDNKRVAYLYKLAPDPRGRKAVNSKGNVKLVLNDFV